MKIANTLDELMFAATQGYEPDDTDLAQVRVPAGQNAVTFRKSVKSQAADIARLHRDGVNGAARRLAEEASSTYLQAFAELLPIPAGGAAETYDQAAERMFGRDDDGLADIGKRMFGR